MSDLHESMFYYRTSSLPFISLSQGMESGGFGMHVFIPLVNVDVIVSILAQVSF
jgi:hypothetical protein